MIAGDERLSAKCWLILDTWEKLPSPAVMRLSKRARWVTQKRPGEPLTDMPPIRELLPTDEMSRVTHSAFGT